jgi:hypothetical protein
LPKVDLCLSSIFRIGLTLAMSPPMRVSSRANGVAIAMRRALVREPSSLRVAFAVLDEYASAKPPPLRSVSL